MKTLPTFVVAAAASGSGKTTFTAGLLRVLVRRGLRVQPFKCGPDYIDPTFHNRAVGQDLSVNLDSFMSSPSHLRALYARYAADADAAVAEGAMGLYDGYDRSLGSAAEAALILNCPILLLVNAKSTAYSLAAVLHGFKTFVCPTLRARYGHIPRIAGVVFNNVASDKHYRLVCAAAEASGMISFGYLPRIAGAVLPERYLGLNIEAAASTEAMIDKVADAVAKHVCVDELLSATATELPPGSPPVQPMTCRFGRIAVARDEAFNFTYRENLRRLGECGELVFFSPLRDTQLPPCDFLYLPGGYPELYAGRLSENTEMLLSIRAYVSGGGRVLAECGGMMYLSDAVTDACAVRRCMLGILPQEVTMSDMKLTLGYRRFCLGQYEWRGHEFHYSHPINPLASDIELTDARGEAVSTALLRRGNVIAGYTHLYWGERDLNDLYRTEIKHK